MRKKIIAIMSICAVIFMCLFLTGCTESCNRSCVDIKSNWTGGLNRIVNVYTANGDLIAKYEGKIDLDSNDGCYVKFDFNGKRYIYFNCFVETIAEID